MAEVPKSLRDLYKERNFLEYNYQHLRIKTIDYKEELRRINAEIDEIVGMDQSQLIKKEQNYKRKKSTKVSKLITDIHAGKGDESRIIGNSIDDVRR